MQHVYISSQLVLFSSFLQLYKILHQPESFVPFLISISGIQNSLENADSQKRSCHFIMRSLFFILPFTLGVAFGAEDVPKIGDYHAPGRADRLFHKRAPRDLGPFEVDCKGSESACNNACFYIRCLVRFLSIPPPHT